MQGGPQGPVQAVFQVKLPVPPDDMGKQVAVEGGIRGQDGIQVKDILSGNELIKADRARWYLCPFSRAPGWSG